VVPLNSETFNALLSTAQRPHKFMGLGELVFLTNTSSSLCVKWHGATALMLAARFGYTLALKALLEGGADARQVDKVRKRVGSLMGG
jgi:hypothetical protein